MNGKLKNYSKPELKEHGHLKKITEASTGSGSFDSIYSGRPPKGG